ncbi:unnamed protein product [Spirodela intermedia]|uniref:Growth-regulating factor n=1 Tax=Spirodela intermedia TaxID=51605 RepID=A0A7I8INW2_SPIIN|nr:unnamed protein product [Spirodela intermedia]CAA6658677.1 unnamed protein product [Spirodela intermedia]
MMSGNSSRCPFTASQWQELEHQALIFKYMASGPGPPGPHRPHKEELMGFGKKVEDPEPWRCRRTDGKKWRCSKEAFPDSKYCERHMHRGKNRSRKPVEISIAATSTYAAAPTSPSLLPGHHLSMVTATEAQHLLNPTLPPPEGTTSSGTLLPRLMRTDMG